MEMGSENWYAWVPTASNPADDPSRLVEAGLVSRGSVRIKAVFPDGSLHDDIMSGLVDCGSLVRAFKKRVQTYIR